jgi:hypothetical protein
MSARAENAARLTSSSTVRTQGTPSSQGQRLREALKKPTFRTEFNVSAPGTFEGIMTLVAIYHQ